MADTSWYIEQVHGQAGEGRTTSYEHAQDFPGGAASGHGGPWKDTACVKNGQKKNKKNAKKWELTLSRKTLAEPPPKDMIMSQISTLIRRITLGWIDQPEPILSA